MRRHLGVVGLIALVLPTACSSAPLTSIPSAPPVPAFATWRSRVEARALEMCAGPDSSVTVRLAESPWLVRHDAAGQATTLHADADLAWASGIACALDGSLYLGGTVGQADDPAQSRVRVAHLEGSGATLSTSEWQFPAARGDDSAAQFDAIALDAQGRVYVLAESATQRAIVRLTATGEIDEAVSVPVPLAQEAAYFDAAQRLAVC